jgi:hypothetical protein
VLYTVVFLYRDFQLLTLITIIRLKNLFMGIANF